MKYLTISLLFAFGVSAHAATSVLLNSSPAYECYRESLRDRANPDLESCDAAIEVQNLERLELAATYANRGILLARRGQLRAALNDHNRAVSLAPEAAATFINRANTLLRMNRLTEAMRDMDTAVGIADDRLPVAHYNRALLFQRIGDIASARKDAQLAAELAPDADEYQQYARALNIVSLPEGEEVPQPVKAPEGREVEE